MRSIKAKYMEQQRFSGLLLASVRKSMNLIGSFYMYTVVMLPWNALTNANQWQWELSSETTCSCYIVPVVAFLFHSIYSDSTNVAWSWDLFFLYYIPFDYKRFPCSFLPFVRHARSMKIEQSSKKDNSCFYKYLRRQNMLIHRSPATYF